MRTLSRITTGLAVMMFVVSCSSLLKKKGDDAGVGEAGAEEAGAATTEPAADADLAPTPEALASNEGDVARFPDEAKLADVSATLLRTYNVREAPPNGELIVGLNKGTAVTQIASRDKYFLITFDDPRAPGTKLMGWVHRDAFSAVVQDAGPLTCPTGEIALFGDTPFCGKLCSQDTDCPTGQACKGSANKLTAGKAGEPVQVCTVFHPHDAGAPSTPDAGLRRFGKSDAGAATVDAGGGNSPADPGKDTVAPTNGQCPANFVLVKKTAKCHRKCTNAAAAAGQCKNKPYYCIKCDNDSLVVCGESQTQCK